MHPGTSRGAAASVLERRCLHRGLLTAGALPRRGWSPRCCSCSGTTPSPSHPSSSLLESIPAVSSLSLTWSGKVPPGQGLRPAQPFVQG